MTDNLALEPELRVLPLATGDISLLVGGSGSPLLLLHHDVGPNGWTPFHSELARDFTVYAPDMPGFGESPRLEWARHPRDIAAIMLNATRQLGLERFTLVGLGFGGWVAAEMAAFAHPEFAAMVLAAPAGLKPDDAFILDQVLEEHVAYLRAGFANPENFDRQFPDPRDKALRDRLDRARENIARLCWKPYMYSYELPETLRDAKLPVTVAWGDADAVIPPSTAALWQATLPNCQVHRIPGAGHFLDLEAPERLAQLVRDTIAVSAGG